MNESRFNSCCDGCYYGNGCDRGGMSESGGETRWKSDQPKPSSLGPASEQPKVLSEEQKREKLVRSALSKLTVEERRALGL